MKQASNPFHWHLYTAAALLSVCLLASSGCSDGGASPPADSGVELSESEIDALKSQAKSFEELSRLVKQKTRERLGIEVPTDKAKKVPKKSRR